MALISTQTDYTDKDLSSLRARLYTLVASVFPEWTDQNVANFGNVLVELYAFVGDVLCFYQDRQAAESRITTATQRRSLIALSKLLAFSPPGATAAQVDVVFSLPATTAGDVPIPAGTIIKTADVSAPVEFQVLEDVLLGAGSLTVLASAEHSAGAMDTFESTGLPNQEAVLSATPYLDGSAVVSAANGDYAEVDNFLSSTALDRHYVVTVDQNNRARLRFGNGVAGAVPSYGFTVFYKTGGGAEGDVPAGAVKVLDEAFTDTEGNPVQLTVTNPSRASGGTPRMSNAAIRVRAPASIRAPVNSVSREDFEINALRRASVARALMLSADEDPAVPENEGNLYVIPRGGGLPTLSLKGDVLYTVTDGPEDARGKRYPAPLTFTVNVLDPLYLTVNVAAIVSRRPGFSLPGVRANIEATLAAWFAIENEDGSPNTNVNFGGNYLDSDGAPDPRLPWSDLLNVVRDTTGVRKIDPGSAGFLLNGARDDVTLLSAEFPVLGSVSLIDAESGQAF